MKISDRLIKRILKEADERLVYISTENWNKMWEGNRGLKRYPNDDYMDSMKPFFVNKTIGKVVGEKDGFLDVKFNDKTFRLKEEFVTTFGKVNEKSEEEPDEVYDALNKIKKEYPTVKISTPSKEDRESFEKKWKGTKVIFTVKQSKLKDKDVLFYNERGEIGDKTEKAFYVGNILEKVYDSIVKNFIEGKRMNVYFTPDKKTVVFYIFT